MFLFRGRIKHTEVCQLLRQMSPPVGIGKKCPKIVAYKVSKINLFEARAFFLFLHRAPWLFKKLRSEPTPTVTFSPAFFRA